MPLSASRQAAYTVESARNEVVSGGLVVIGMHRREVKYLLCHEAGALECAESQYGEGNVLLSRQRTEESEIARPAIFSSRRSSST